MKKINNWECFNINILFLHCKFKCKYTMYVNICRQMLTLTRAAKKLSHAGH